MGRAKIADDLRAKRDRLMAALSAVLEASTDRAIAARDARGCQYHRAIAKSLHKGDTIITFNYDCVMDDALRREGDGKWSARFGYGFSPYTSVENVEHWSPSAPAPSEAETIRLLKLHGSIHWQFPVGPSRSPVKLKQRLHSQRGTPRFDIVPPEWNKSVREQPLLRHLWRQAFRAIRSAERVAVIGFSFTPTDLHVESLFRLALTNAKLKTLVIANPSAADRERIRRVFAPALERTRAVVRQYDSLGEVAASWPDCFEL